MALFKKREKTAREKANKAQMGIFARLIGCAYLIYVMITLLRSSGDSADGMSQTLKITIAVIMLAASAFVIVITVLDFIRNLKYGAYKESTYFSPEERAEHEAASDTAASDMDEDTEVIDVEYSEADVREPEDIGKDEHGNS